jgi:hypothetical protein
VGGAGGRTTGAWGAPVTAGVVAEGGGTVTKTCDGGRELARRERILRPERRDRGPHETRIHNSAYLGLCKRRCRHGACRGRPGDEESQSYGDESARTHATYIGAGTGFRKLSNE